MENQELFDKYIHGELSPGEKVNFESKLKADKEFAKEFKTFLLVVQGIQKEEQQDCADFGAAMKKLSKGQLHEITRVSCRDYRKSEKIAAFRSIYDAVHFCYSPDLIKEEYNLDDKLQRLEDKSSKKKKKFSPWLWSSLSAAAVVAIVVIISFNMINQSQSDVNNAQYMAYNIIAENNFIDGGYRGGSNMVIEDFSTISDEELNKKLPLYETAYQQAQDDFDIQEAGLNLAMIYLKLHNKDKTLEILTELNTKYKDSDPEFAQECQNIINQIEKIENKR